MIEKQIIKESERSQRLQINKFAMISIIWDRFIENSKLL